MFRKVLRSLASKLSPRDENRPPGLLGRISSAVSRVQSRFQSAESRAAAGAPVRTPEEWCGITAGMSPEEIRARLALLYRRFNRATSSLDPKLRAEAEVMLDAIVAVREKTFGPI